VANIKVINVAVEYFAIFISEHSGT
jgi:hypothetical protein